MNDNMLELLKQNMNRDSGFPIKIGNEIYRIKNRLSKISNRDKTHEQILKSIARMQEILNEEGFEIIDLINLNYNEGMTVKVRFIPTNDSSENNLISKVIKPQINYNGQLIQIADIEVKTFKSF